MRASICALCSLLLAGACDEGGPSLPAAPSAEADGAAGSKPKAPEGEDGAAEAEAPAKAPNPADGMDLEVEVSGPAFDGPAVVTIPNGTLRPKTSPDRFAVTMVFGQPLAAADASVRLGAVVLNVRANAAGVYEDDAVQLTLNLEREGHGVQPMRSQGHEARVEVTRFDAEAIEGTFTATLERTNTGEGPAELYQAKGRFELELAKK